MSRAGNVIQGIGQRVGMICTHDAGVELGPHNVEPNGVFISPRFTRRGYVLCVFHDYRTIEYFEDKVKEEAINTQAAE